MFAEAKEKEKRLVEETDMTTPKREHAMVYLVRADGDGNGRRDPAEREALNE